jgi:ribosomal protein S18 acetylase RimI-like enzyme
MIIKIFDNSDLGKISQVAGIHANAYSAGHFTAGFSLAKLSEYNARLIEASDITILAMGGDNVLGFVISGFSVSAGVKKFTADNRLWLVVQLLKRPSILLNKLLGLVQSRLNPSKPSSAKFRLLSIATLPGSQSKGVGVAMLKFLEQELLSRDVELYGLSVKNSNIAAIRFYERHGFVKEKSYLGSSYYIKKIVKK